MIDGVLDKLSGVGTSPALVQRGRKAKASANQVDEDLDNVDLESLDDDNPPDSARKRPAAAKQETSETNQQPSSPPSQSTPASASPTPSASLAHKLAHKRPAAAAAVSADPECRPGPKMRVTNKSKAATACKKPAAKASRR